MFVLQWRKLTEQLVTIRTQPLHMTDGLTVWKFVIYEKDTEVKRWGKAKVLVLEGLTLRD